MPYSWSVSNRRGSQQSREVEDRLLKILHSGLSPRQLGDFSDSGGSRSGYCNIQDLKSLLESRKAYWQTQTSPGIQSLDGVTTRIDNRESSVMVNGPVQSPIKPALPQFKGSEAAPVSENRATHYEKSLDDLFRSPQCNRFHNQRGAESVEPSAEDDFIFFQELDAAYCAILEPKGASVSPLGPKSMVENESRRSFERQTQRESHPSHQKRHPSLCGSIDTLMYGQPDLHVLPAFAQHSLLLPEDLGALSQNNSTILRPSGLNSTRGLLVPGPEMLSKPQSRTAPESCSPIPPGFWRQKRLY